MERRVFNLASLVTYIGYLAIMVMMFLVVADVIARFAFNRPLMGANEIVAFSLGILVFSALAWTEAEGLNVVIPILYDRLSSGIQKPVAVFINFLNFAILALMTWQLFAYAQQQRAGGEVSAVLTLPTYPFIYFATLGSCLFAVVALIKLIEAIRTNKK